MRFFTWLKNLFTTGATPAEPPASRASTEFSAEVVQLISITSHPNAERLELAKFQMDGSGESGYEVVIQKGAAKVGDLMAYFSVDCILPLSHPEFKFLAGRADGAGKTHFRLRAARLRGVFSQGLLVPAPPEFKFGDSLVEHFGVTYHSIPEPSTPGNKSPASIGKQPMPIYKVDSLKKQPFLFAEGEPVCITEKIHGTNFRFGWVRRRFLGVKFGWQFVVGSHRTIRTAGKGKCWYDGGDLYLKAAQEMDLARLTRKFKGHIFFGELYGHTYTGQKIQDLTYGQKDSPALAVFDIKHERHGWLDPFDRFDMCMEAHLEHVPILAAMHLHSHTLPSAFGEGKNSCLSADTVMEGVVVESLTGPRRKAKFVSEAYMLRKGA